MENELRRSSEIRRVSCQENFRPWDSSSLVNPFCKGGTFWPAANWNGPRAHFLGVPNTKFFPVLCCRWDLPERQEFVPSVCLCLPLHFTYFFHPICRKKNAIFINSSTLKWILFSIEFVENYFPLYEGELMESTYWSQIIWNPIFHKNNGKMKF